MDEVNSAFEYMDEEGLKQFNDSILQGTEDMLDGYITNIVDQDSSIYEFPSARVTHSILRSVDELIENQYSRDRSYRDNEIDILFQLTCLRRGEHIPIPTDLIVIYTGILEDAVQYSIDRNPIRDDREGIRYRYYFVRENEDEPYALYIYEEGEWRVVGYTKDTLMNYWSKSMETEECIDRILNGSYETPIDRVREIVHESWDRIHEND